MPKCLSRQFASQIAYSSCLTDCFASVLADGVTISNLLKFIIIPRRIYLTKSFFKPYQLSYHRNYIYL